MQFDLSQKNKNSVYVHLVIFLLWKTGRAELSRLDWGGGANFSVVTTMYTALIQENQHGETEKLFLTLEKLQTTPLTFSSSTLAFQSAGRMEIDLLDVFNRYKRMDYFIAARLL